MNESRYINGFEVESIEKCHICNKENTLGIKEMLTEWIGIGEISGCEEFCEDCFKENSFRTKNGFTFLRIDNNLYCRKPDCYLDFGFRPVLSERDIDRAFNPERYDFDKWLEGDEVKYFSISIGR